MGTVRWDACKYARNRGSGPGVMPGEFYSSGITTSSTTASDLDDGAAGAGSDVTFPVGVVLHLTCDELCRVSIGGVAATVNSGFLLQPGVARDIEITTAGTVSVCDEA